MSFICLHNHLFEVSPHPNPLEWKLRDLCLNSLSSVQEQYLKCKKLLDFESASGFINHIPGQAPWWATRNQLYVVVCGFYDLFWAFLS